MLKPSIRLVFVLRSLATIERGHQLTRCIRHALALRMTSCYVLEPMNSGNTQTLDVIHVLSFDFNVVECLDFGGYDGYMGYTHDGC